MKISSMLEREDFYEILRETLEKYWGEEYKGEAQLYFYAHLNAGITSTPSPAVKSYLKNEYRIRGNVLKSILVKIYLFLTLNSRGLLADSRMNGLNGTIISQDTLIYPCNKKIRIFNFKEGYVDVIIKNGFLDKSLKKEIAFREQYAREFILPLEQAKENGYRELIVDGIPLARYQGDVAKYQKEALELVGGIGNIQTIPAEEYIESLNKQIEELLLEVQQANLWAEFEYWLAQWKELAKGEHITLKFSHGDLQAGNIWIRKADEQVIVIDWESWDMRSEFYDSIVLYTDIRQNNQYDKIYSEVEKENGQLAYCLFVMEDVLYKLQEMGDFPHDIRKKEYNKYFGEWEQAMDKLERERNGL